MRNSTLATMFPLNCKRLFSYVLLLSLICFSNVSNSQVVVVAGWDVNLLTGYGASPLGATTTGTGVTVVGLTRGAGLTTSGTAASNAWGSSGYDVVATAAAAITNNDFWTFKITADANFNVSLSSISAYNIRRTAAGPATGLWQYQIGAGTFNDIGTAITWGAGTAAAGNLQSAITLSGIPALQNVPAGTTITFRIVGYNSTTTAGTNYFNNFQTGNDLIVNGTITAVPSNYNVTYDGNGNTGGAAPLDGSSPYVSGSNVTVLGAGTLVRTGYTFTGWNTVAGGGGTAYSPGGTIPSIAANTTLFAQWTINTYAVTYDGNTNDGGTAPVDPSSPYNFNSNVTVLGQGTLTKTGYTFNGWNTAAGGGGTAYVAGGTISGIAAGVTLYAQWVLANTYAVTYLGNGNTGGAAPVDGASPYAGGSNVTVLGAGTLVRTGYTFAGWNTVAGGGGTAYSAGGTITSIAASTTLYAQWTINTYTVTYDGNGSDGGTVPVDPSSPYNFNSNVTVLGVGTLTRTNYSFTGWNTAAGGGGTAYAAGATITGIAANTTLFAQWTINTFTVTYNGNTNTGGTAPVDPSSPYAATSNVTVLGAGTLVKTGYSFTGWNTLADGSGTPYAAGATISNILANTALFAQWSINSYTVTYNGNTNTDGTAPVDPNSPYTFGATVTVLTNSGGLVKTGATFVGWNTAADGTGTTFAPAATFTLGAANVVLYAKWAFPLYESFSYTAGQSVGGSCTTGTCSGNNWTTHSGAGALATTSINVVAGSLNYTGLQASAGEKISIVNTLARDINRSAGLIASQNTTYYSFLLNVTDATALLTAFGTAGNTYFMHLSTVTGVAANFTGKVHIRSSNAAANFRLGISEISNTPVEASGDLNFGTTYLIVVKYVYNNTAGNDLATMWVNPVSLGGSESAGGINGAGSVNVAAYNSVNTAICIRNAGNTPKASIDEIRVGTSWASVTPTSSFTITATAQTAGGSISPSGAVTVSPGANQAFTITKDACNDIADVIVDGATSVLGDLVGNTYTFTNVTANHTIDVYFNPSTSTTWTGAVNNDWDNAGNWTSCVPNATLDVFIPQDAALYPILNVDAEVNSLSITGLASLVLNGKTLTINGGYSADPGASLIGSDASSLVLNSTVTLSSAVTLTLQNLTINGGTTTLSSAVDISGGTATVLPGNVSVQAGSQLQSNGFLTIKSNQFGTARVATGDDAGNYITGDVTVERYIPNNGFRSWRFLSVPTFGSGQTIRQAWQENQAPMANGNPGFGTQITGTGVLATAQAAGFDNIAQQAALLSWGGAAWVNATTTNTGIATKKGYMLYLRGERSQGVTGSTASSTATTLRTKGQLYQGTQAIPSFSANSLNAVGNLYASAIDFTQLTRTGGVNNQFYIWDSKKLNGVSLGAYQTFSATNSFNCLLSGGSYTLGQPNTKIESGQAFFVSTGASAGSITLTEGSKIANGANLGFRPVTPVNALVKIDSRLYAANSTEITDANVVVFNDKYTNAVADEDAAKFTNPAENFGIQQAGKTLSVEGRHTVTASDNIQFNMWNLKEQQYKLEFVPQNMATPGLTAILEDKYLKTTTPVSLDAVSSINFTVDANAGSKATDRFRIVFTKVKPVVAADKQGYSIAPNPVENGKLNLVFSNQAAGRYSVRIVSNSGQAISTRIINHAGGNSNQQITLPTGITSGMYQVEITAPNHTKTTESLLVK